MPRKSDKTMNGKKRKRKSFVKRRLPVIAGCALAALALGFFVVLPELVRLGALNSTIEAALSSALGAEVHIGGAELSPTSQLIVHKLSAFHAGEPSPFLTVERFRIGGDIASINAGSFDFLEASNLWIRLSVRNGRLDWKPPTPAKKIDIPAFTMLNASAEISIEGAPVKLATPKMVIQHFGGDKRTQVDANVFVGESPAPVIVSAGFLADDLINSLTLNISADDFALPALSSLARLTGHEHVNIQDGRAGLRIAFDKGAGFGEVSFSDVSIRGLGTDSNVLRLNGLFGVEFDAARKMLTMSPRSDSHVEVDDIGRLDISGGSFISFAGASPEVDVRCAVLNLDLANILSVVLGPNDPRMKGVRIGGVVNARNVRISGTLPALTAEIHSEIEGAAFSGFGADLQAITGPLHLTGDTAGRVTAQTNLSVKHGAYSLGKNTASEEDVGFSGTLSVNASDMVLKADGVLTLSDGGRIACSGSIGMKDGAIEKVKLESDGEIESQRLWSVIQRLFLPEMAEWQLKGKVRAKALINTYTGKDGLPRYLITWNADLNGCDAIAPVLAKPLRGLVGRASAEIVIGSSLEEARNIDINLSNGEFDHILVSQGLYSSVGEGIYDIKCRIKSRNNKAVLDALLANPLTGEIADELAKWDATAHVALVGTGSDFTMSLESLAISNAPAHPEREREHQVILRGILAHFSRSGDVLQMTASIPELDLKTLWSEAGVMFPSQYRDMKVDGVLGISGGGSLGRDGRWKGDVKVSARSSDPARGLTYSSGDDNEQLNLGNMDIAVHVEKEGDSAILADTSVALGGFYYYHSGQAPFTVDLSDKPLLFKASVELKDGGATLLFHDTRLRIESLGEIVAGGSANLSEHGAISIFAQITNLDSNTLFTKLLADNYSGNYEFLENLKVSGTVTSGGVLLQGPLDALRITGRVALSGFGVSYKDFVVENLNADIPVDVAVTGVSKGGDQPHEGVITFSRFGVGAAQIVNKRLPFHATGDAMVFDESIAFDVPGGRLTTRQFRIENISLSQIHGHETRFRFSDFLGDLDLALLTKTLGWKQMDGAVKVRLGNIVLDGEEMSTEGTIDMAAFGGDIAFSKLSASSVFRGPAIILFSADINNVSLSNISHTFGFGEISGTLSGKITDFEYVLGTANGFEIDLEVVKGEGQFVRPEFLRDFMFVNTGRVLDLPRNVLVALGTSRSYAYKEFGIHAILKNNILTLGSKYKYQGQEAYMTAPWYGGVNIINENPGRQYRWKPIYTRISNVLSGKGKVKINQ